MKEYLEGELSRLQEAFDTKLKEGEEAKAQQKLEADTFNAKWKEKFDQLNGELEQIRGQYTQTLNILNKMTIEAESNKVETVETQENIARLHTPGEVILPKSQQDALSLTEEEKKKIADTLKENIPQQVANEITATIVEDPKLTKKQTKLKAKEQDVPDYLKEDYEIVSE